MQILLLRSISIQKQQIKKRAGNSASPRVNVRAQLLSSAAIAPAYQFLNRFQVPGGSHAENEMGDSSFDQPVTSLIRIMSTSPGGALNLAGIAPDFFAPAIQNFHFARQCLSIAKSMPHI